MAHNLEAGDLVVVTQKFRQGPVQLSARVLKVYGPEAPDTVAVQVNGLDHTAPMWGERFLVDASQCEKSHD